MSPYPRLHKDFVALRRGAIELHVVEKRVSLWPYVSAAIAIGALVEQIVARFIL
jgi:hypothetical protein